MTRLIVCDRLMPMKYYTFIIICLLITTSGCVKRVRSRYDAVDKQTSYVSMRFELDEKEYVGKTKSEITQMLGEPVRILEKAEQGAKLEKWIYYPEATNNYIAIIISFQGDTVKSASYESVM